MPSHNLLLHFQPGWRIWIATDRYWSLFSSKPTGTSGRDGGSTGDYSSLSWQKLSASRMAPSGG